MNQLTNPQSKELDIKNIPMLKPFGSSTVVVANWPIKPVKKEEKLTPIEERLKLINYLFS